MAIRRFATGLLAPVLCAIFGLAPGAFADSTWINTGTGSWADAANWLGGVPGSTSSVYINNGGTARLETGVSGTAIQILTGTAAGSSGSIEIAGGTLNNYTTYLGYFSGTGTATVTGGSWIHNNNLHVGYYGTGVLLLDGGLVQNTAGYIGNLSTGSGTATVTSGTWRNTGSLTVGNSGSGTLLVNGGLVQNTSGTIGVYRPGSVTVTSGSWINSGTLIAGENATGTITIEGGLVQAAATRLGNNPGATASVSISSGTLRTNNQLHVGYSGSSTATLTITGGLVQNSSGYIANELYSRGTVTVTSGTWLNSSALSVGTSGTASLTITDGLVQCDLASIAETSGSKSSLTVNSGGAFINSSDLTVGMGGSGTLTVNGGLVSNRKAWIGRSSGTGTVTVTSGTWVNTGSLTVGGSSRGSTLTIQAGGVVTNGGSALIGEGSENFPTIGSGNRVLVTGEGSTWKTANGLVVGQYGSNNLLTVRAGGLVQIGDSLDDNLRFSTQGSATNNFLRMDDGYVALFGDRVVTFEDIIINGSVQTFNGSTWSINTDTTAFTITYFATNAEGLAATGYDNLGGYTVLTIIPEPTAIALVSFGIAGVLARRRRR